MASLTNADVAETLSPDEGEVALNADWSLPSAFRAFWRTKVMSQVAYRQVRDSGSRFCFN